MCAHNIKRDSKGQKGRHHEPREETEEYYGGRKMGDPLEYSRAEAGGRGRNDGAGYRRL